jgi:predicted dehydrogenase
MSNLNDNPRKVRIAVIGLWGHECYAHQAADHYATELAAVCGYEGVEKSEAERLRKFAEDKGTRFVPDYRKLLEQDAPEACVVMLPPRQAAAVLAEIMARGIHVLSEKPFVSSLAEARQVAAAWGKGKGIFSLCLPLPKYDAVMLDARRRIEAGEIGRPLHANFMYLQGKGPLYIAREPHFRDADLPASALSGGEAAMFSGYAAVALEFLTGAKIEKVFARTGSFFYESYQQKKMEDLASAVLKMQGGVVGLLTAARTPSPSAPTIISYEITGETGQLSWDSRRAAGMIDVYSACSDTQPGCSRVAACGGYDSVGADFVEAVRDGREARLTGKEAFSSLEVLSALYRSAATGEEAAVERIAG